MGLYNLAGELTAPAPTLDLDHAAVRRPGRDVCLLTYGAGLYRCLEAATQLAQEGIEAEVIDLRTLRPLDEEAIIAAVRRCHRAVVVDEGWRSGSISAEIAMRIMEHAFYDLDAPVARVCTEEIPIPYPKHLEDAALPQPARIVATVRNMMGKSP
jgi:pyruvate/2-oxoglutarate/acetoin dehydrogenase E1 component